MNNVEKKLDKIIDLLTLISRNVSNIDDTCDDIEDSTSDNTHQLRKIKDSVRETGKYVKKMCYVETLGFSDEEDEDDEDDYDCEDDYDDYDDTDDHDFTPPRAAINILNHTPTKIEIDTIKSRINDLAEKLKTHGDEDAADDLIRLSSEAISVLDTADDNMIGYALIAEYTKLVSLWYLYSEILDDDAQETVDKFKNAIEQRWCFSEYDPSQDYDNKEALKEGFEGAYNSLKNMLSHMNDIAKAEIGLVDELSKRWFHRLDEATTDVSISRAKMKLCEILDMYEGKLMSGVFDDDTENAPETEKTGSVLYDIWAKSQQKQPETPNE